MKHTIQLGDVERTMLIPLYGRAIDTKRRGGLVDDARAVEIVEAIDYDFTSLRDVPLSMCVIRTAVFDNWISRFLHLHPRGTVIEIGAGLNARFDRLDNGVARWIDVDLPDAMALRRRFFADTDRRTSVAASVLDEHWPNLVRSGTAPYIVVAEGVFAYLVEEDVRRTLEFVARRFPKAFVAFDTVDRRIVEGARATSVGNIETPLRWACANPREVEGWSPGFRLVESWSLVDLPPWLQWRLPAPYRYWTEVKIGRAHV